jgi:predicted kinase
MHNGNFLDRPGSLILLSGLPGVGKTTFALALKEGLDLQHIESDAIRRSITPVPTYSQAESGAVFARVDGEARRVMASGRHALVDATNLTTRDRKRFVKLANDLAAPLIAVRLVAPDEVIRERLLHPREGFSQADLAVFERMMGRPQRMSVPTIVVDTRYSLVPAMDLILRLLDGE